MNREKENDRNIARENKNDLIVFGEVNDDEKDEKEKKKKSNRYFDKLFVMNCKKDATDRKIAND